MPLPRRRFLGLAAGAAALPAASRMARGQEFPTRPVRILVGFAPGGSADIVARLVGGWLAEQLGRPFIIENRIGAGNNVATEAVVRAPPDGHTLLLVTAANAINATLYDRLSYDFMRDIAPVANVASLPYVMMVTPTFPATSVREFIAYAKAHPGEIAMASAGNGTVPHLAGEMFKMMAGVEMIHVPYRGGSPALADLLAGRVQVMFGATPDSLGYIRAGQLRALAVTSATRLAALPDVPRVSDDLPGYEASAFHGVGAPGRTPAAVVDKLNREINAALGGADKQARLRELGTVPVPGSPADFARLIAAETAKWARVVKFCGAKVD
jgi:tripartite-type tricarboxylate transporter receptor subunit TctC